MRTRLLTVPHPRLAGRRFALAPLAELVPRRIVPGTGRTVARLLAEAPEARVRRAGSVSSSAASRRT
jgi:7,8-dihydro-6-hydroxymethylpterin-pyrophosphokinase